MAALLISSTCMTLATGCGGEDLSKAVTATPAFSRAEAEAKVQAFCGDCHATPRSEHFSKDEWLHEVQLGYEFYDRSKRKDLTIPPLPEVLEYFRTAAPERFADPTPEGREDNGRFVGQEVNLVADGEHPPAISHLRWAPGESPADGRLFYCDMFTGLIRAALPKPNTSFPAKRQATTPNSARIELVDLDGDGRQDLLTASLGSFFPEDHRRGALILHRAKETGGYEPLTLLKDVGRVCDAQTADFDGDDDLDIVVAVFGWLDTGQILLLTNETVAGGPPKFTTSQIDKRHGTIHVPVVDLNGDGKPDFVALVSQEFEAIDAFINQGAGRFARRTIHEAGNPAYGSSGIELADMDLDGDIDILYTNGDSFDSTAMRPYHGLQWLENQGNYPFKKHDLGRMPGAHRALAGDYDRDGDIDVFAVSMLADATFEGRDRNLFDAAVWLEQVKPGRFERRRLESARCRYASLEKGDFDGDGDLDLAAGVFRSAGGGDQPELMIWWNQSQARAAADGE